LDARHVRVLPVLARKLLRADLDVAHLRVLDESAAHDLRDVARDGDVPAARLHDALAPPGDRLFVPTVITPSPSRRGPRNSLICGSSWEEGWQTRSAGKDSTPPPA